MNLYVKSLFEADVSVPGLRRYTHPKTGERHFTPMGDSGFHRYNRDCRCSPMVLKKEIKYSKPMFVVLHTAFDGRQMTIDFGWEGLKFPYDIITWSRLKTGYHREVSSHEPISPNLTALDFTEVEIDNTCGHGCKVYENVRTGERVLAHNSAYGCRR